MTLISFRLDDITAGMGWDNFLKVKKIFDENNIKPLIGVVPYCLDEKLNIEPPREDFWIIIKRLHEEGWIIAQHGFQHLYKTANSGMLKVNKRSEFAGLPLEEQLNKILKGKSILEKQGIFTDIFMAPAHSYDKNTVLALKEAGFKYVTDGYTSLPYEFCGIKFIPCMHSKPPHAPNGTITVCLHTNSITEKTMDQIKDFIAKHRDKIVDYSALLKAKGVSRVWKIEQRVNIVKFALFRMCYFTYRRLRNQ
jgi:predicted deacetylase